MLRVVLARNSPYNHCREFIKPGMSQGVNVCDYSHCCWLTTCYVVDFRRLIFGKKIANILEKKIPSCHNALQLITVMLILNYFSSWYQLSLWYKLLTFMIIITLIIYSLIFHFCVNCLLNQNYYLCLWISD